MVHCLLMTFDVNIIPNLENKQMSGFKLSERAKFIKLPFNSVLGYAVANDGKWEKDGKRVYFRIMSDSPTMGGYTIIFGPFALGLHWMKGKSNGCG